MTYKLRLYSEVFLDFCARDDKEHSAFFVFFLVFCSLICTFAPQYYNKV